MALFEAGDGRVVMLGLQNEREWKLFCDKVLRQPELANDPRFNANVRRAENRSVLRSIVVGAFCTMIAAEVVTRLDEAQIANAAVNQVTDLWSHPQLHARQRFCNIGSPVGPLQARFPPATSSDYVCRMAPVPALGEHSEAILRELGRSDAVIAGLRSAGIV